MGKKYNQGIVSPKGFDMSAAEPVDQRSVVDFYTDLASLANCYPGLEVSVEEEGYDKYRLVNIPSSALSNWEKVEPGVGEVGPEGPAGADGEDGVQGPTGATGVQGEPGIGIPTLGATNQVLAKIDNNSYNTYWADNAFKFGTPVAGDLAYWHDTSSIRGTASLQDLSWSSEILKVKGLTDEAAIGLEIGEVGGGNTLYIDVEDTFGATISYPAAGSSGNFSVSSGKDMNMSSATGFSMDLTTSTFSTNYWGGGSWLSGTSSGLFSPYNTLALQNSEGAGSDMIATNEWVKDYIGNNNGDTLPIIDTTAIVKGSVDATKLVRIEADSLTTATTRVLTMADYDIDMANVPLLDADNVFTGLNESPSFAVGSSSLVNPSLKFEFNGANGTTNENRLSLDAAEMAMKFKAQTVWAYADGAALRSDINTTTRLDAEASTSKALITKEWAGIEYEDALGNPGTDAYILSSTDAGVRSWIAPSPDASTTVKGIVELAIASEVDTGTSTTLAITPDALEGSALQASVNELDVLTIRTISITTDTLVIADKNKYIRCTNATSCAVTVPPNSSVAYLTGTQINIRAAAAGQVTMTEGAGVTINTAETLKLRKIGSSVTIIKVGTDEWDITGDLEAV